MRSRSHNDVYLFTTLKSIDAPVTKYCDLIMPFKESADIVVRVFRKPRPNHHLSHIIIIVFKYDCDPHLTGPKAF